MIAIRITYLFTHFKMHVMNLQLDRIWHGCFNVNNANEQQLGIYIHCELMSQRVQRYFIKIRIKQLFISTLRKI